MAQERVLAKVSLNVLIVIVKEGAIPKEILLDTANGEDTTYVAPETNELDAQMCALLNHLVRVIGVLRRSRIGVPFDI